MRLVLPDGTVEPEPGFAASIFITLWLCNSDSQSLEEDKATLLRWLKAHRVRWLLTKGDTRCAAASASASPVMMLPPARDRRVNAPANLRSG